MKIRLKFLQVQYSTEALFKRITVTSRSVPADQTYAKTDTGPDDDNGTAGATGLGLYV